MSKATYRAMTALEKRRAQHLAACSFTPGTFAKRFARDVARQTALETITDKQAAMLERLCWTFRRQLPKELVPAKKPEGIR